MSEIFVAGMMDAPEEAGPDTSWHGAPLRWQGEPEPILARDLTPTEELLIANLVANGVSHADAVTAIAYDHLG